MNLGDYHTKHHSAKHHREIRHEYLTPEATLNELRRRLQELERKDPEEHKRFTGRVVQGKLGEYPQLVAQATAILKARSKQ